MSGTRVLSGMRPTGSLHIGHLKSVLEIWRKLQDENTCFFLVADIHALTTDWEESKELRKRTIEMVKDWIASGISPEKSVIMVQSEIKQHTELFTYLSMITPIGLLERNPTYKEFLQEYGEQAANLSNLGFFSYPVLQASDILIYKAHKVPVGKDQVPHIEITRDIAEKFNRTFGEVFPLPQAVLSEVPKILGTDGRKMSKSYGNAIVLTEDINSIKEKIKSYMTDTARKTRKDPGEPERCPLYTLHKIFTPLQEREIIEDNCRKAKFGCLDCKKILSEHMIPQIEEFQANRNQVRRDDFITDVIREGNKKAQEFAEKTMEDVRKAIFG